MSKIIKDQIFDFQKAFNLLIFLIKVRNLFFFVAKTAHPMLINPFHLNIRDFSRIKNIPKAHIIIFLKLNPQRHARGEIKENRKIPLLRGPFVVTNC